MFTDRLIASEASKYELPVDQHQHSALSFGHDVESRPIPAPSQRNVYRTAVMVSPNPNLRAIVNDDGAAILDIEHDSISTLNPTGACVWQGLQRGESLETIIAKLARDTGEEFLLVERDVREFVEDLKQKRLLPH